MRTPHVQRAHHAPVTARKRPATPPNLQLKAAPTPFLPWNGAADGAIDRMPNVNPLEAVVMLLGGNMLESVGDFAEFIGIPRRNLWDK
jgi:hypothetical protein